MEILTLFIRTVLTYFTVFIVMRLMGKREIGKLSVFDLVISIMIAEIAVFVIEDSKKPLTHGFVPMGTLLLIQLLISYLSLKNRQFRLLFDATPTPIIQNGQLNKREMRKQRYNLDDLMMQLRQKDITHVGDVEFACLETDGKLTVVKKEQRSLPSPLGKIRYELLPLPLIMDGKVQDDNLAIIQQTRFWLKNQVQAKGASDFKDVFFCTIDHRGKVYVDLKEQDYPEKS